MKHLLIRNGRIVNPDGCFDGDLLCTDGRVAALGRELPSPAGAEVIDAGGLLVLPGFVDPHVHIHLPFMGTLAKDTWESAGRAALLGGTTTLIEMICPARGDDPWEAYQLWRGKAEGVAACDFSFHMGVSRHDAGTDQALRRIVSEGVASFKVFLAYKGAFGVDDAELYRTLTLARELGVVVAAHCENETLVAERCRELLARGVTGPEGHHESRPPQVEAEGVHHFTSFLELTGATGYIVHLSCREALEEALAARRRGVRLGIETLIQYLLLDKTHAELPNFEGAKYVMSPPLRDRANQEVLWRALRNGEIDTVATDHAPFDFATQKRMGLGDFTRIPNGIPSLQDRVALLHGEGVVAGRLDLPAFVRCASTNAARWFGLFPRKGVLLPGADADVVLMDPRRGETISAARHAMAVDYNPFEGRTAVGSVRSVFLRGQPVVQEGKFVGRPGSGKFLARAPGIG